MFQARGPTLPRLGDKLAGDLLCPLRHGVRKICHTGGNMSAASLAKPHVLKGFRFRFRRHTSAIPPEIPPQSRFRSKSSPSFRCGGPWLVAGLNGIIANAAIMQRVSMPPPTIPPEYREWLVSLKEEIHPARRRAALAVNSEVILLYWRIGQEILARQAAHG
jgi:hypothetical protein